MQNWTDQSPKVSTVQPNTEKAKSLLLMVELREKDLENKPSEFSPLIVESLYEILKELMTAILAIDGFKTISHELLISYLKAHCSEFTQAELMLIDQLRKTRNDIAYRGVMIPPEYLKRNRTNIEKIIQKLKKTIESRLS